MSDILARPIEQHDLAHVGTVGEYVSELLTRLINEEDGFDPKRPFGNSDWTSSLHKAIGDTETWGDLFDAIHEALTRPAAPEEAPQAPEFEVVYEDRKGWRVFVRRYQRVAGEITSHLEPFAKLGFSQSAVYRTAAALNGAAQ